MHIELLGLAMPRMIIVPEIQPPGRGTGQVCSYGSSRSGAGIEAIALALVSHVLKPLDPCYLG